MKQLVERQSPCRGGYSYDGYDDGCRTDDYGYAGGYHSDEEAHYYKASIEYYGNDVYYDGYHTDDYGYAEDYTPARRLIIKLTYKLGF